MRKYYSVLLGMVLCMAEGHAQNIDSRQERATLDEFRKSVRQDFDNFRKECMEQFVEFVRNPWKEFEETPPVPRPKEEPVPPVVHPEDDKDKPVEDHPVVIDEVIKPVPIPPQPQPVEPIEEVPVVNPKMVDFVFIGTAAKVRFDTEKRPKLEGIDQNSVANALMSIKQEDYDNMLLDCIAMRDQMELSDWAYIRMLQSLVDTVCGHQTNEATLLLSYLYMQSGYKMRLATDGSRLYMLYATEHVIYDKVSYFVDGDRYYGVEKLPSRLFICNASYPKEKKMSLLITTNQKFAKQLSEKRIFTSAKYSDISITVKVNRNLMDFYNTYPSSILDNNIMTKWAIYANAPMDKDVKVQVYPVLKDKLKGLSHREAVDRLLNLVQTGFVYEYDDKVWGGDRVFFVEESLYYPYCDCEDRSILFTRLVRDLLGLDCILVYYPGHLASAVAFPESNVKGDYILLGERKYIVTDPTDTGKPVGHTMLGMDNATAKVILLE